MSQFFVKNPMLRDAYKGTIGGGGGNSQQESTDIVFDLIELSSRAEFLEPYIDYICAVIRMYAHMCLSRNHVTIKKVKEAGLNYDHISTCIISKSIHEKLRSAYVFAVKVLFIDNDPFPSLLHYHNRCYLWKAVERGRAHRTMYKWERKKYEI